MGETQKFENSQNSLYDQKMVEYLKNELAKQKTLNQEISLKNSKINSSSEESNETNLSRKISLSSTIEFPRKEISDSKNKREKEDNDI